MPNLVDQGSEPIVFLILGDDVEDGCGCKHHN